jgi:hypothetical protein
MTTVPNDTPVTIPVTLPMFATDTFPLLHTPPVIVFESVVLLLIQAIEGPEIDGGTALVVKTLVAKQPVANV